MLGEVDGVVGGGLLKRLLEKWGKRFRGLLEVIYKLSARILEVRLFVTFRPQSLTALHNQLYLSSRIPT